MKFANGRALLAAFLVLFFCAAAMAAPPGNGSVADGAGILSEADVQRLSKRIQEIDEKHDVRIGIHVQQSVNGSVGKAANKLLDASFSGAKNGGMVLLLSMGSRDWYISTDNAMRQRITDDEGLPYLRDRFLGKLKEKDYAGAMDAYLDTVDSMLSYYEQEGKPYDPSDEFNLMALLAALVASGLGGWLVREGLVGSMSNVARRPEAGTYLVQDSVHLAGDSDTFLFMNVTRAPKRKSSDGSMDTSGRDSSHGGGGGKF